ncbi:MAG: dihydroorotase, partial [Desulfobacterales bacterium]|nr:dihydroorotase [Desulfobacterales bacterium]
LPYGMCKNRSADLTIIDPSYLFQVTPETLYSKSKNTPFEGWNVQGKAILTMRSGKIIHQA